MTEFENDNGINCARLTVIQEDGEACKRCSMIFRIKLIKRKRPLRDEFYNSSSWSELIELHRIYSSRLAFLTDRIAASS
jgi:hypothetical protein